MSPMTSGTIFWIHLVVQADTSIGQSAPHSLGELCPPRRIAIQQSTHGAEHDTALQ
jgi:hypothetical protein